MSLKPVMSIPEILLLCLSDPPSNSGILGLVGATTNKAVPLGIA